VRMAATATKLCLLVVAILALGSLAAEADTPTVNVTVPAFVSFAVTNVKVSTTGSPNPFTVSFTGADHFGGLAFRISVKAVASSFTPPAGSSIPASKVSWSIVGAQSGTGYNGTLSSTAYTIVYQSVLAPSSGSVRLAWSLAAPDASGLRAGNHTLSLTWRLEAVVP
jgi:hypothetical protein